MKKIAGIWLPDTDTHFEPFLMRSEAVAGAGTYQLAKYREAVKHVRERAVAVDVGAHVGLWSRVMAQDFEKVIAFEPLPPHIECFRANTEGMENVQLHELAIADKPGALRVHMPASNTGHAHVCGPGESDGYMVEAIRLDDFDFDRIDFLKIDVEGYELQVIQGAQRTIKRHRPIIQIEQKKNNAERYGRDQFAALYTLELMGLKTIAFMHGDYLMGYA